MSVKSKANLLREEITAAVVLGAFFLLFWMTFTLIARLWRAL